jgi:hypothetical protein
VLHLKAIYAEAEMAEAATIKSGIVVRSAGGRTVRRQVKHYNLEAILAGGPVGLWHHPGGGRAGLPANSRARNRYSLLVVGENPFSLRSASMRSRIWPMMILLSSATQRRRDQEDLSNRRAPDEPTFSHRPLPITTRREAA